MKWEVVGDFLADEDSVDHMAAEHPHFYLVFQVQVDSFVLVDALEDVGSDGPVGELELFSLMLRVYPFRNFLWACVGPHPKSGRTCLRR